MADPDDRPSLLPASALENRRLALSVSESADLPRLGLTDQHLRLALGEVARVMIVSGGGLAYGGHLDPAGYTAFVANELQRYGRRDEPLKLYLSWTNHQPLSDDELTAKRQDLALLAELILLDPDGKAIGLRERAALAARQSDETLSARSLSSLRRTIAENTDAQFCVGGRREGFVGNHPGVVEETMVALELGRPLYLAGGFGGATLDIARALEMEGVPWFKSDHPANAGSRSGLEKIAQWRGKIADNGLSAPEQALLLASYRPSEIAALVGLGMGRLFGKPTK